MLLGRLFAYHDAQLYRVGANHQQLAVNRARCAMRHYQRGGAMTFDNAGAAQNYRNIIATNVQKVAFGNYDTDRPVLGQAGRFDTRSLEDVYTQAGDLFR
jgi:catalase